MDIEKIQKIALTILGFAVGFGAFFLYRQSVLRSEIDATPIDGVVVADAKYSGELIKESLVSEKRDISGIIRNAEGNTLVVEAEMVDLDKIDAQNYFSIEGSLKVRKSFEVAIDNETEISFMGGRSAAKEDLKTGMHVGVVAEESVYEATRLTADQIIISVFVNEE